MEERKSCFVVSVDEQQKNVFQIADPFSLNVNGYTAIDVHETAAVPAPAIFEDSILTKKSLFLMLNAFFSGFSFASMANFRNIFDPEKNQGQIFSLADAIWCPNLLPWSFFFFIVLLTFNYTLGVLNTLSTVWSLNRSGFSRSVMLFITGCTSLIYVIIVGKYVPRFYISTIGSGMISSLSAVWLYVIALIGVVWLLGKTAETLFFRGNIVGTGKNTV